ncbi:MAG: ferredoxin [Candidatus Woesearchaeota archaeon]|nr:MAG: ferredoxin [Candidatus Woesearchaeota archaeon]
MAEEYTLQHDRPVCIGCGACASIAPDFWEMNDADNKSDIKGGVSKPGDQQELKISQPDFDINMEAAEACPVNCIHLIKNESGEKLI